jgi:hypothetical protein
VIAEFQAEDATRIPLAEDSVYAPSAQDAGVYSHLRVVRREYYYDQRGGLVLVNVVCTEDPAPVPAVPAAPADATLDQAITEAPALAQGTRATEAGRLTGRRRFVDPTAGDRGFADAELEFMRAMEEYKRRTGRMFPTWSEVLEVLSRLGYEKVIG